MQMGDLQSQIGMKSNEVEERRPGGCCLNMEVLCAWQSLLQRQGSPERGDNTQAAAGSTIGEEQLN